MVRRHLQLKNLKVPFKHHVNSAFWLSSLYRTLTVTTITSSRNKKRYPSYRHVIVSNTVLLWYCHAIIFRVVTPVVVLVVFLLLTFSLLQIPSVTQVQFQQLLNQPRQLPCVHRQHKLFMFLPQLSRSAHTAPVSHLVHHDSRNTGGWSDKINSWLLKTGYCWSKLHLSFYLEHSNL